MTFKIESLSDGHGMTIRLIGQVPGRATARPGSTDPNGASRIVLDLEEITVLDVDAIRFLRDHQAEGVVLINCSSYITASIDKERSSAT